MKIACESPICLVNEESRYWNDFDYALAPFFEKHEEYYAFFVESLKANREVLVDNSPFNSDNPIEAADYSGRIRKLVKDSKTDNDKLLMYIIPYVEDNCDETIKLVKEYGRRFKKLPGRAVGVLQGKTTIELYKCYHDLYPLVDIIAIPARSKAYEAFFDIMQAQTPKPDQWVHGRELLLEEFYHSGWLTKDKPLHLLGAIYPDEPSYYNHFHKDLSNFVDSVNLANPVIQGSNSLEYDGSIGTRVPFTTKLESLMESIIDPAKNRLIQSNIRITRTLCRVQTKGTAPIATQSTLSSFLIPADGRRK